MVASWALMRSCPAAEHGGKVAVEAGPLQNGRHQQGHSNRQHIGHVQPHKGQEVLPVKERRVLLHHIHHGVVGGVDHEGTQNGRRKGVQQREMVEPAHHQTQDQRHQQITGGVKDCGGHILLPGHHGVEEVQEHRRPLDHLPADEKEGQGLPVDPAAQDAGGQDIQGQGHHGHDEGHGAQAICQTHKRSSLNWFSGRRHPQNPAAAAQRQYYTIDALSRQSQGAG